MSDPDEGSNASDDRVVTVLEGQIDDPTGAELEAAISSLSDEEQIVLVALAWTGRGDFGAEDLEEAKMLARERRRGSTARYLMGMPLLGDYLEGGAAELGINLTDIEFDDLYHRGAT